MFNLSRNNKTVEAWINYNVPHRNLDNTFESIEKINLPMLVVPRITHGYFNSNNRDELRGYYWNNATNSVSYHTWPNEDIFEDQQVDLNTDPDGDGRPNFYIVWIYISTKTNVSNDPTIICPSETYCGDESCDNVCGEENINNCNDCLPHKKKVLRLDRVKVVVDERDRNPSCVVRYHESYMSGKYEIAATYLVVKNNGTLIYGFAYCDNELNNPTKFFGSSTEVKRKLYDNNTYKKSNNGTPQWKTDVKVLTDNFNPQADKVYIMFWELDRDYSGGDLDQYKRTANFPWTNLNPNGTNPKSGLKTWEWRSKDDPPFGDKRHLYSALSTPYHYETIYNQCNLVQTNQSWHMYEIPGTAFSPNGSGKMEWSNSGSSSTYGIEFVLDYDL